jgi:predicted dehydrogenase
MERVPLKQYNEIYDNISNKGSIASILEYPENSNPDTTVNIFTSGKFTAVPSAGIGIIGAGNFTKMTMLPVLKSAHAPLVSIASKGGVNGTALAKKYNIAKSTTDYQTILQDAAVNLVIITTRHDQHASLVTESLKAGKHVFVEKPLAITPEQLEAVIAAHKDTQQTLTVGFNRRFSSHAVKMKQLLGTAPMNVIATMNAGNIPPNVWVHDMKVGGGRIIGEACHFIDLITFLTGSKVNAVCMNAMGINPQENTDNVSILLRYENGSTGVINYFANGSKAYSKERVEVYSQERTLIMDNFRTTAGYGFRGFSKLKTKLDKGHKAQFSLLAERAIKGGEVLIPFDEIVNTTKASFAAIESLKNNNWIEV